MVMSGKPHQTSGILSRISQSYMALLGAVVILVLLLFMWWQASIIYQDHLMDDQQIQVEIQLISYGAALTNQVNLHLSHLKGLESFAQANPTENELDANFESFASGLYSGTSVIRSIQLFPAFTEVYVYPVLGNEAVVGRSLDDLINDERSQVRIDVQRAIQTREVATSGPYELRQGGLGMVVREPVFINDSLWGMAVLVFDIPPLLHEAGLDTLPENLNVVLSDGSGQVLHGSNDTFLVDPMIYHVDLPESGWELAAVPVGGWSASIEEPLDVFKKSGLVIVFLLTTMAYFLLSYNTSLKKEVKERTLSLSESQNRYQQLFDNNSDALFLIDENGRILDTNIVALERYGYSKEELLEMFACTLSSPHLRDRSDSPIKEIIDHGMQFKWVHVRKDETEFPVEINARPLMLNDQKCILASVRDITESKKAEEALIRSEEMFSRIFNTVPEGMILTTSDEKIVDVNETFLKNTGFAKSEIIGKTSIHIGFWYDSGKRGQYLSQLKSKGVVRNFAGQITTKSGEKKDVLVSGDIIATDNEDFLLTIFRDITELKSTELALQKSESLLNEVSMIAKIGGWSFDVATEDLFWTPEVYRIHDHDLQTLPTLEVAMSFYTPNSKFILEKAFQAAIEKGESYDLELEMVSAKRIHKWVRANARPIILDDKIIKIIGSFQDITENKEVELALHERERLLNEVGSIAKIGGWEFDVSTGEGTWTPEVAHIHDLDPDDETNKEIGLSFYSPDSKVILEKAIQDAIEKAEPYDLELELISAKGIHKWVRTLARPIMKDGKVVQLTGSMQDITELKLTFDSLRESEERFRATFEQAAVGVCQTTLDGIFIQVNQRLCDIIGYDSKELLEMNFSDISYPEDFQKELPYVEKVLTGEINDYFMEKRYICKDGRIVWVNIAVTIVHSLDGKPLYLIGMIEDIDKRKQVEEEFRKLNAELEQRVVERTSQLEEANKELEAFTYSVSHDLRAPLRAIDGFSKIIMEDYEDQFDEEGERLFNVIRTNTQKMDNLITDLLALSRIGRNEMIHVGIDMNAMVRSVFNDLIVNEDEKSFVFTVSDLPMSCADPTLIKQLWINLLSNAVKYSMHKEEKKIHVGTYTEDGINIYYVRDNGVGFDSRYSHKLFGIFQRLHNEKEFDGTGVGLAIVQRIVSRHGGKVWAESEVNEGATFYFSLPMGEEHVCGE